MVEGLAEFRVWMKAVSGFQLRDGFGEAARDLR
jgi:hypothetical protein